jgi:hypothetical protein
MKVARGSIKYALRLTHRSTIGQRVSTNNADWTVMKSLNTCSRVQQMTFANLSHSSKPRRRGSAALTTYRTSKPRIVQSTLPYQSRRKVRSESPPLTNHRSQTVPTAACWTGLRLEKTKPPTVGDGGPAAHVGADPIDSTNFAASREEAAAQWRRGRDCGTRSDEEPVAQTGDGLRSSRVKRGK